MPPRVWHVSRMVGWAFFRRAGRYHRVMFVGTVGSPLETRSLVWWIGGRSSVGQVDPIESCSLGGYMVVFRRAGRFRRDVFVRTVGYALESGLLVGWMGGSSFVGRKDPIVSNSLGGYKGVFRRVGRCRRAVLVRRVDGHGYSGGGWMDVIFCYSLGWV